MPPCCRASSRCRLKSSRCELCTRVDSSSLSMRALRRPIISKPLVATARLSFTVSGDQGNALDNPEAGVDEFVFGDNVINNANAERFLGVDVVARQGIPERACSRR